VDVADDGDGRPDVHHIALLHEQLLGLCANGLDDRLGQQLLFGEARYALIQVYGGCPGSVYTQTGRTGGASATDVHGSPGMVVLLLLGGVCALLHARRAQVSVSSLYWSLAGDGIEQSSLEAHRDCNRERRRRQRQRGSEWSGKVLRQSPRPDALTKPENVTTRLKPHLQTRPTSTLPRRAPGDFGAHPLFPVSQLAFALPTVSKNPPRAHRISPSIAVIFSRCSLALVHTLAAFFLVRLHQP
jgi:hypothetical protein